MGALLGVLVVVGMLPWFSGRDPAQTILRARSAEQEASAEALAAIRADLGLDAGAWGLFTQWASGVFRGDFGLSWVNGKPVLPGMLTALTVSLSLMVFAVAVALAVAAVVVLPALVAGVRGRPGRTSGIVAATLTALPEFLLASVLLLVGAVWLGAFPPYGWSGPAYAVLPALALGLPAGGLVGRLAADAVTTSFTERWVITWAVAGFSRPAIAGAVLRRALPGLLPQIGLVMVAITGGAVAVEVIFSIPGLGRAALGAANSQDIPALQAAVMLLLLLGTAFGVLAEAGRRLLLGRALRAGELPAASTELRTARRRWIMPVAVLLGLVATVVTGLGRDPLTSAWPRLAAPNLELPFGADASGRDLLARVAHGAVATVGLAVIVAVLCTVIGLLLGLIPRLAAGPIEIANAAPPIITGLLIAAVLGAGPVGAAVAVTMVSWAPLAAHTAALASEARAQPHLRILPVLGVGRARILFSSVVPAVVGPVARHGLLRLPGIALALAALGFLGLGSQPPQPNWGLVLAEGMPYVERAPWVVLAPIGALVAVSVLAVSAPAFGSLRRREGLSDRGRRRSWVGCRRSRDGRACPAPSGPPVPLHDHHGSEDQQRAEGLQGGAGLAEDGRRRGNRDHRFQDGQDGRLRRPDPNEAGEEAQHGADGADQRDGRQREPAGRREVEIVGAADCPGHQEGAEGAAADKRGQGQRWYVRGQGVADEDVHRVGQRRAQRQERAQQVEVAGRGPGQDESDAGQRGSQCAAPAHGGPFAAQRDRADHDQNRVHVQDQSDQGGVKARQGGEVEAGLQGETSRPHGQADRYRPGAHVPEGAPSEGHNE